MNQWTFVEHSEKRADLVVFINGLPLVIMELKSPSREETGVEDAYNQLRNYMHEIPSMFIYNAICILSYIYFRIFYMLYCNLLNWNIAKVSTGLF